MRTLTKGNPIKLVVLFTIPLLIGNVFQQLYSFMDALIVGRTIGVNALAAVGATGSLTFLVIGFAQGTSSGLAIPTAQAYGARDFRGVRRSFVASIWLAIIITVIGTALSVTFTVPLLHLMQTPASIVHQSASFVRVIFMGFGASMAFNVLSNQIRALGDSRTPLIFLVLSTIVNILLELLFILKLHMGVAGAGWATVTAQVFSSLCCWWYIRRRIPMLVVRRHDMTFDLVEVRKQMTIALPMGFQQSIIAIGAVIIQVMLNTLGTDAVAAYTAAGRIDQLASLPAASFGVTMATYAAQNKGAREFGRIRQGIHQTMALNMTTSAILGALIIIFGRPLVNLFLGNGVLHVTALAQTYFHFNASMYWFLALLFTVRYTLQGLGQTLVPTLAGVFELVMRIFAGVILVTSLGFTGAAMANPLAWIGSVSVLIASYLRTMRRLKEQELAKAAAQ
ncbi:MATE family efflux transporter [Lacticaseibacillus thailandensis]|uniref:MATE family efflux transporter n=1 Tax=Lacticaseibacillus thailandensis TaxID=381741 RepID=UPI0007052603|nr:MATE family efflux transporter [Lacticaseibacillus thailandensis]